MRTIGNAAKAAFKVLSNGIKKAKHKAEKLVSGFGNKKKDASDSAEKSEGISFPVRSGIGDSEDCPQDYKDLLVEKPFKDPVFIEMGQDPDLISAEFRKIGKDVLFLYDIDDTLYHPSNNLQKMERKFLEEKYLSFKKDGTLETFKEELSLSLLYSSLFYNYVGISLEEYWEMLSEFDYLQYLSPDVNLRNFLLSMKNIRRCCFTNGPRDRAENILAKLGVLDCFEVVISIGKYDKTFCCKPLIKSYEFVTKVLGIESPGNVYFFDDSEINIIKAREFGWNGELITRDHNIIDVSSRILQEINEDARSLHFQKVSAVPSSKMPSN
ncbi:hypothetical protein EROM_051210 [Encephalitozoon romaleae SJ-2008]|uniref:Pyrimidine 5-nucleotidase n=1 Tax=Encephalitozoon romaleae (strain SJ-2008) TaxID=1178016 RepID=I7ARP8_ENCRO|nr:hypothetical protein EROM_051210 [Encephalitozoon romaleae SJ-2008]AFN83052.1 hypothetical protein EROM_051210 [Encephalitozoon romaleae SJ-2008]